MTTAETREMLERAWVTRHGKSLDWFAWYGDASPSPEEARRFRKMLDAEAYLSAAEMLVPEGWNYEVSREGGTGVASITRPHVYGGENHFADTPALALLAAIQVAREIDNG